MKEIQRKFLGAGLGFILTLACSPQASSQIPEPHIHPSSTPLPTATPEVMTGEQRETLNKIEQEVTRIARTFAPNSLERNFYLEDDISKFNSLFKEPIYFGLLNSKYAYLSIYFIDLEYNGQKRFRFLPNNGQLAKNYSTMERMGMQIDFSTDWLNIKSDEVKALMLKKIALQMALYDPVSILAFNTYKLEGKFEKLNPQITDLEIGHTIVKELFESQPSIKKQWTHAAYLPILSGVGQLLQHHDPTIQRELSYVGIIYQLAAERNIPFDSVQFGTIEFLQMTFDPKGEWYKIVSSLPDEPNPASPTTPKNIF
ncbi:hypothetical protein HY404_03960 [Candidatus Microgenomates bacterium]|nr:hypothetical protein [Candidatus Microgenomates bacterium]